MPKLKVTDTEDPVVQVIDQQLGEPIYTLRINGQEFQPHVSRSGACTIRVSEGDAVRKLTDVASSPERDDREISAAL